MMKKLLLLCLPFAATVAMAQDNAAKYAELITVKGLKQKLTIIASAEMEGRETASPGQQRAAAYIEEQFKKFGLQPGNGSSYQQMYPVYIDSIADQRLRVNGKTFAWGKDYSFALTGVRTGHNVFNNLVFAGYGNAEDYTGLNVKGKVVIVVEGGSTAPAPTGRRPNPLLPKIQAAQSNGAIGLVVVTKDFSRPSPAVLRSSMRLAPTADPTVFVSSVSNEVASALIGRTTAVPYAEFINVKKGDYVAELEIGGTRLTETKQSSNVIAVLPGTDKKDEYLFLTGHYDHLGKRGDVIYYGADDDGSGTVSVMQMAEAFSKAAKAGNGPRRSIIFMTVSGEEKGLLGSEYYSEHPTIDMSKASADLNTDMVGRLDTERKTADSLNYIYVIGHDKLSSDLPVINEGVNKKYTNLVLDYKYDDPKDENFIYFRSDHYNFAKKGVPILFFYDGMLRADYHQPTDTVDKINFELMEKRVKLVFHTAWEIANRDNMLKRDTPLNMPSR